METKRCVNCNEVKGRAYFYVDRRAKDGLRSWCKACTLKRNTEYRHQDPQRYQEILAQHRGYRRTRIEPINEWRKQWRAAKAEYVARYLSEHPCVDCGEADIVCLDFDHVTGNKVANISKLVNNGSMSAIKLEITKCEVVCANCHRKRTAQRGEHFRWLFGNPQPVDE